MMLLVFISVVLGALWRRWLGLANSGPRPLKLLTTIPLLWPVALLCPDYTLAMISIPLWPVAVAVAWGLSILFFLWRVDSARPWPRYFIFGLGYVLAYGYWRNSWNRPPFIDGATAIGELFLGGSFFGALALLGVLI